MIFGRRINKYYFKYAIYIILGIAALVFVDIYQLKIPEITGAIVDGIKDATLTRDLLISHMKNILIIVTIMFIGRFMWRVCILGNGVRIEAALRDEMFKQSLKLSQKYYSENKTGAIMALYTNDLQTIRRAFGIGTVMLFDAIFLGILAFSKMWRMDKLLTIISVVPLLLIALMGRVIGKYMSRKFSEAQRAFAELSDFTQESFSGISVIRAFVKEAKELLAFNKINKKNKQKNIEFARASVTLQILIGSLISSIFIIIVGYGGYLVYLTQTGAPNATSFTLGDLTIYFQYFGTLIWPMMAIAQLINMRSQATASLKRINELFDQEIDIVDGEYELKGSIKGAIEYRDLSFSYPNNEKEVLHNISFKINAGENIGVLGRTGSGKTTLVDLLLRIYNVEKNKIFIDGVDIMDYKVKDIRNNISYVPQDNFLFSDKIKNNINFSKQVLNMEEVIEVTKLSDVHENIIEFTDGYDTILGERGVTVSGGQKQRISIARALMKNAPILILDDSVSAVDTKTEEVIISNLKKTRKGKTTILIAHRVSTVKDMDKIILLDQGRLIGFGTFDELLETNEVFQRMVELQRLEEEVGGSIDE
ncbi:MAG TPA: ABC transporter ATP-binding protein [Acholeplasmataceae bacterium]|nr:ABC transporter ATP-binding protein [Acholeplasmataceae bacterium]